MTTTGLKISGLANKLYEKVLTTRIVRFATLFVLFMVILYVLGGLGVLFVHLGDTIQAFKDIFICAFTPQAAVGRFTGVAVMKTM